MYIKNDFLNSLNQIVGLGYENKIEFKASITILNDNAKMIDYYYYMEDSSDSALRLLNLYGLLQGLFVSIDALYQIAYIITNSKSFISINNNPILRELKYIRNDVVGHPTNRRVLNKVEYSILDLKSLTKEEFIYKTYTGKNEEIKKVNTISLIESYFIEAKKVLDSMYQYQISKKSKALSDDVYYLYKMAYNHFNIGKPLKALYNDILSHYKDAPRIIKKIELILYLNKLEDNPIHHYLKMISFEKLYQMIGNLENIKLNNLMVEKVPSEIKEVWHMLKLDDTYPILVKKIYDINHPGFKRSILFLIEEAKRLKFKKAYLYFNRIYEAYLEKKSSYVYALSSVLKK